MHVLAFRFYEVGDLPLPYVDKKRRKEWDGFLKEHEKGGEYSPEAREPEDPPGVALTRIEALRRKLEVARKSALRPATTRAVSFAAEPQQLKDVRRSPERSLRKIKQEESVQVISDGERSQSMRMRARKNMRTRLVEAAEDRQKTEEKRARSKHKKKKKKTGKSKKRKRSTSSSTSSSQSSSTDSNLPPLQKMSQRRPGSVLDMLNSHVAEALNKAGVEEDASSRMASGAGSLISSYFQILLKGEVKGKVRDLRELDTLARCLDMLQAGQLAELGDSLSGRFIAVENAALAGSWADAQHLEVLPNRTPGIAQTSVLLKAQRHARVVERASGRGSWNRGAGGNWRPAWKQTEGEGETRGKGKKNKGKKGKKGAWKEKGTSGEGQAEPTA